MVEIGDGVPHTSVQVTAGSDCTGPGATDLPSTELVPDAVERFRAVPLPTSFEKLLHFEEAAPCAVAKFADTGDALVTGHYVSTQWQNEQGKFEFAWAYYDDQGQFQTLCGPCETNHSALCTSCAP
jgi:hypothetical protein